MSDTLHKYFKDHSDDLFLSTLYNAWRDRSPSILGLPLVTLKTLQHNQLLVSVIWNVAPGTPQESVAEMIAEWAPEATEAFPQEFAYGDILVQFEPLRVKFYPRGPDEDMRAIGRPLDEHDHYILDWPFGIARCDTDRWLEHAKQFPRVYRSLNQAPFAYERR